MNMNVKLDGEDEQSVHFPNRATIALQSGPAAYINLNIVNPNISNPSYILNPVSSVPQNFVAYQSPVTLQSYITLQEADGNIVNNLQVGVPVPIGLPVSAELLHNPNLVNTSIIIGNEDCNQPVIFKPATASMPETNDIKFSYVPKPEELKSTSAVDNSTMRLNDMPAMNVESSLKKPCPLEMSIKAANIDLECDPDDLMPETNGLLQSSNYPIMQKLSIENQIPENVVLNVPVKLSEKSVLDGSVIREEMDELKKRKTEITWDDGDQPKTNEFQESLICEVEEANEDDDEKSDEKSDNGSSDNEALPLSVVLKLRRVQEDGSEKKGIKREKRKSWDKKWSQDETSAESKKFLRVRHCCSKKECFKNITLKDQKIAHNYFHELETTAKQDAYLINCIEHKQTVRSASSKTEDAARMEDRDKTLLDEANIQMEIENESNGNQTLCDEIQQAIQESLKDCMANQVKKEDEIGARQQKSDGDDDDDDNDNDDDDEEDKLQNWNYYLVIDRCRKKICLQFLLKLFQITKSRIRTLQGKILSGQPLSDDSSDKSSETWDLIKEHMEMVTAEEHPFCRASPRHRFLNPEVTVEGLYDRFREFYKERTGNEVQVKSCAFKRFLKTNSNISFSRNKEESCAECDSVDEQQQKNKKREKVTAVENSIVKLDRSFQIKKKGRKKWDMSSDSEWSSDDEPLAKRKKLRLTISLKGNRVQNADSSEAEKRLKKKPGKDGKGRTTPGKGRDVWSLMLLHLETMPYKVFKNCFNRKRHRFFDTSMTKQTLYEDYRRYFLKETNSELGLGFTMYEKYFDRNCGYTIGDVDVNAAVCPRCAAEPQKHESAKSSKKTSKTHNNNIRSTRHEESIS